MIESMTAVGRIGFLFLCLLLPLKDAGAAGEPAGTFAVVEGEVVVVKPGFDNRARARTGDPVLVGDILRTGGNGKTKILLADDSLVFIPSRSVLRINQYAFDPAESRRSARIQLLEGRARFIVGRQRFRNSLFSVETEHAVIGAGPADFSLAVADGESTVAVIDGSVSVKNISNLIIGSMNVSTNQQSVIARKSPPTQPAVITSGQRKEYRKF